ncbi:NAD-P-binding protein [Amylostereum chailletii]|nr:NAD-P-binding protein [Amylostereum chailletii]
MLSFLKRLYLVFNPEEQLNSQSAPLNFAILGAANIAPIALILPVKNHPDAVVYAVAARDHSRADAFAKKWNIAKAYGGPGAYQALLDDPEVDVVYNPLPNGLHYEWTMKALAAGKHVLLEKPSADSAEESRNMFLLAEKKGLVLMEAFHYRFHPAMRRAKEIVDSGELGTLTQIDTSLAIPQGFIKDDDIRLSYDLGGGSMMDMGCYTLSVSRYLAGADPERVLSATADTSSAFPKIDLGATAALAFPNDLTVHLKSHFRLPPRFGFIPQFPQVYAHVVGTKGEMTMFNHAGAWAYHYISVDAKDESGKVNKRTEKRYGNEGWTTYRYQLEAFVDKLRGRTPEHWFDAEDSITNMYWLERIYEALDLGVRPTSTAEIPELP